MAVKARNTRKTRAVKRNPRSSKTVYYLVTESLHIISRSSDFDKLQTYADRHNESVGRREYFVISKGDYEIAKKSNTGTIKKPNSPATEFVKSQTNKLRELAKRFQGHYSGDQRRLLESDHAPNGKYRLGHLKLLRIKRKGRKNPIDITFDGDSMLSADVKNNLWVTGRSSRITNIKLVPNGMVYLGELQQVDYITAKSHIENGNLVHFYHKAGEVTGELPKVFADHDGFPIIIGGNYDVWDVGIVN